MRGLLRMTVGVEFTKLGKTVFAVENPSNDMEEADHNNAPVGVCTSIGEYPEMVRILSCDGRTMNAKAFVFTSGEVLTVNIRGLDLDLQLELLAKGYGITDADIAKKVVANQFSLDWDKDSDGFAKVFQDELDALADKAIAKLRLMIPEKTIRVAEWMDAQGWDEQEKYDFLYSHAFEIRFDGEAATVWPVEINRDGVVAESEDGIFRWESDLDDLDIHQAISFMAVMDAYYM